jgi:hypothetical protein
MMNSYQLLLNRVAQQPDVRIDWLNELLAKEDTRGQISAQQQAQEASLRRFKRFVHKPRLASEPLA